MAVPVWLGSTLAPFAGGLYLTVAWVPAEFTVTEVTLAVIDLESDKPACALMVEAKAWPFCSNEIFLSADVAPLKNASQFDVTCPVAPEPEPGPGEPGAEVGAAVVGAAAVGEEPG